ncbi:protein MODIFIED TRANSPORT TO THE VACUOLE 1 [Neltuma alba]|uniref:protein MODIFIED TRANSPORT TO THE VACUOLE 1 n=1 Tax=Neltuma alba TaxID=207710 RepID=UPI0010A35A5D|nr:protein MODIFIED TRANSPORT TO THE VACUOLE 1-like [Prosopis alba]XP_028789466.1 protein MODIFIED TRANSPORT TO THE VACUOLE 1-like [Prosopis alba]
MESSRRAVESYWRSRLIDSATSDEDKVTPVYKLEEVCELLRSSHVSIVKEVSEFILKRLEHKSPIVKQKALRLIKYAVGKSGVEFRREMQRHSVAVRQLFHYKGHPDPLKGDALNKAVRDTAHEAISAIFSAEDGKPTPAEDLNRRIQGFGNTNFESSLEDKKSFISEVVGLGSASIKQGLSNLAQGHSIMKNETGTYKSPNLRRSLTIETEDSGRYEPVTYRNEAHSSLGHSKNQSSGSWNPDSRVVKVGTFNDASNASHSESKTREDRLLETIVTSGGVRLQPTRDALQVFLTEAAKLDALSLSHSLELKLQSPMWQVRMKAVCVLEAILRKRDDDTFSRIASYFTENKDVVVRCSESPQASLREKANKVIGLLGGDQPNSSPFISEKPVKAEAATVAELPNLIDTDDSNENLGGDDITKSTTDQNVSNLAPSTPLVDDLFGDFNGSAESSIEQRNDDDPFADVSFHTNENKGQADDLFSGITVSDKQSDSLTHGLGSISEPETFDIFASNSTQANYEHVNDLMSGLSVHENASSLTQKTTSSTSQSESLLSGLNIQFSQEAPDHGLANMLNSQAVGSNANPMFPTGHLPYNAQPGIMLNHMYPSQPLNYNAMGSLLAQQQFLATMANFQHLSNVSMQDAAVAQMAGTSGRMPMPDIFQPNFPTQTPTSMISSSKKEDTKAFDFISDHISAARDTRKVI